MRAPDVLLQRAAIRDDRLKTTAIFSRDVHDNPRSHAARVNCFGQFWNRLNEFRPLVADGPNRPRARKGVAG
jgi:hypothetical protein